MAELLISWLTLSLALWVTSMIVPGFMIRGVRGALVVGALFGVLNFALGKILFLLIVFSTLFIGLIFAFITRWIVTAIVLKITNALTDNLSIDRFSTAMIGSAVLSLVSLGIDWIFR